MPNMPRIIKAGGVREGYPRMGRDATLTHRRHNINITPVLLLLMFYSFCSGLYCPTGTE